MSVERIKAIITELLGTYLQELSECNNEDRYELLKDKLEFLTSMYITLESGNKRS